MTNSEVRVRLVDGFTGLISARTHATTVDRRIERGGADLGFTGGELLLAAQGGCFMTTLAGAAEARGITLHRVDLIVRGIEEQAPPRYTDVTIEADVEADAPDEEIDKLLLIAERGCTVSNTLKVGAAIAVSRRALAATAR
ncbi:MAG: OsmC family protein [Thermomicrobiales bacterium]